ncbi:MAG: hypothetical protein KAU29_02470, partial [Gammaproteobacteria bacterium]|nr:hypothetical protein [Gammaproteobacteria bacterium]
YRQLPWDTDGVICDSDHECYLPGINGVTQVTVNGSDGEPVPTTNSDTSEEVSAEISPKSEQGTS